MIRTYTAAKRIRGRPAVLDQPGCRMADPQEDMKLVIIGDGNCGKTCLLDRFEKKEFTGDSFGTTP